MACLQAAIVLVLNESATATAHPVLHAWCMRMPHAVKLATHSPVYIVFIQGWLLLGLRSYAVGQEDPFAVLSREQGGTHVHVC